MTSGADDADLDCLGLLCPLPVLKSRRALRDLAPGRRLRVVTTDPMAAIDIPHMCATDGHALVGQARDGETMTFTILRGNNK